jgi:hypothetical protein
MGQAVQPEFRDDRCARRDRRDVEREHRRSERQCGGKRPSAACTARRNGSARAAGFATERLRVRAQRAGQENCGRAGAAHGREKESHRGISARLGSTSDSKHALRLEFATRRSAEPRPPGPTRPHRASHIPAYGAVADLGGLARDNAPCKLTAARSSRPPVRALEVRSRRTPGAPRTAERRNRARAWRQATGSCGCSERDTRLRGAPHRDRPPASTARRVASAGRYSRLNSSSVSPRV